MEQVRRHFRFPSEESVVAEYDCKLWRKNDSYEGHLVLTQNNLCFFEDVPRAGITKEGFLYKQSLNNKSRWNRRYFSLDGDTLSFYISHDKRYSYHTKGIIPIADIHSIIPIEPKKTKPNCFQILTSYRIYTLACDEQTEADSWISVLNDVTKIGNSTLIKQKNMTLLVSLDDIISAHKLQNTVVYPDSLMIKIVDDEELIFCFESADTRKSAFHEIRHVNKSAKSNRTRSNSKGIQIKEHIRMDEIHPPDELDINVTHHRDTLDDVEFHAHFNLSDDEHLIEDYGCALLRTIPLRGRFYISQRHVCFKGGHLLLKESIVIPIKKIIRVSKKGYHHIIPKTIMIETEETQFLFGYFAHRKNVLRLLDHMLRLPKIETALPYSPVIALEHFDQIEDITGMNVVIVTVGSRGDVQPFIALAHGLIKVGHRVKIATHEVHRNFVEKWGLEFSPLAGNPTELLGFANQSISYQLREGKKKFGEWIIDLLNSAWIACQGADVIIENPPSFSGVHIAEKLEIPLFEAFTMPWTRTAALPHPFAYPPINLGSQYNYTSYLAFEKGIWSFGTREPINTFRTKVLNLLPLDTASGGTYGLYYERHIPFLYCWSPTILPKPADWPYFMYVTGYWFLDSITDWKPPQDLLDFLDKEPKPFYIGFGSVADSLPDLEGLTKTVIEGVLKAGQRAVISGLSKTCAEYDQNFFLCDNIPHDWLFPRLAGVVHHGGAGTTAAALRAGVPTLIIPFFGDQFLWADRVEAIGVGPRHIPSRKITAQRLSDRLLEMAQSQEMKAKAANISELIRAENGVEFAVKVFQQQLVARRQKPVFWKIQVTTGTSQGSSLSSQSSVFVTLFGDKHSSNEIELQPQLASLSSFMYRLNPFKKGRTVEFLVETQNLGHLKKIIIRHNNKKVKHGWFLDQVMVSLVNTSEKWLFPCKDWLSADVKSCQKELYPTLTESRGS